MQVKHFQRITGVNDKWSLPLSTEAFIAVRKDGAPGFECNRYNNIRSGDIKKLS